MKKLITLLLITVSSLGYSQNKLSIALLSSEITADANSVLVEETTEIDATSNSKIHYKSHSAVAILNEKGNSDFTTAVSYDPFTRVKKAEVFIYDAFGNRMEHFKKKDFKDVSAVDGFSLYLDDRILYLKYTPTTYPYFIVFDFEIESTDTAAIPRWFPINGYSQSTVKSVFKMKYNPANKPRYKPENFEDFNIETLDTGQELIFSASNLKAIREEGYSPSFYEIAPFVRFALNNFQLKGTPGKAENWQQFGSWMDSALLSDVNSVSPATIATVKNLIANETTAEGKARKIYQYVQNKVRYVSIQIGIGGWKPMPAADVDNLSYGDCKALTNYTKTLLDIAGVPSYYTILYAGENKRDIANDFASIQGNHVILALPDGDEITWLECTSQDIPFGYIGNFTDDRDVLMITPEGGIMARTKAYKTSDNRKETTATLNLDEKGNVTANFLRHSTGLQYDEKYQLPKQKQDEIEHYFKSDWSYLNGFSINDIKFENNREDVIFSERATLSIPHYANKVGADLLFCPNIFSRTHQIPPRILNRQQKLYISEGYIHTDTLEIELPSKYITQGIPENQLLETQFGTYETSYSETTENKLQYTRKLYIKKGTYPPGEYENYRNFWREIARLDKTKILIKSI